MLLLLLSRELLSQFSRRRYYLELIGLVDDVEMRLDGERFLQTLLEQPLECHNLLDVAEKGVDLGRGKERFLLQRLQIVLQ